jgi:putative effector of murein hydrolase LrgA (UPF0299 family)
MSRSDRIKEELGWLKLVFAASVAIDVSLVGWLAENSRDAAQLLVVGAFIGVIFTSLVAGWINRAAMRRFRSLEDE